MTPKVPSVPWNFAAGGLSACGKTTVGEQILARLAHEFPPSPDEPEWQIVDLGDLARARADSLKLSIEQEAVDRPGEVDLYIEEECRQAFRRGRSIVLGRLPWMVGSEREFAESVFRLWIDASPETRAGRRYEQRGRDKPYDEYLQLICGRDADDERRYKALYADRKLQFPPQDPYSLLDLVVSAEKRDQRSIAESAVECARLLKLLGPDAYVKVQLS